MLTGWLARRLDKLRPKLDGVERRRLVGDMRLSEHDPVFDTHAAVTYVPQTGRMLTEDPGWGLFDEAGAAIGPAFYRRGPGPVRMGGGESAPPDFATIPILDDHTYVYAGQFGPHFGHFLLSGMARLWPLAGRDLPADRKLVYHGVHPPEVWFGLPYTAAILSALGLSPSDFAFFDRPVRFARMMIPGPSYEEMHGASRAHARLGVAVGQALAGDVAEGRTSQPLYLSRQRLPRGTHRIANEDALAAALATAGFAFAFPEELDLAEQIRLLERHETVVALVGSALHASLLSRRPNGVVGVSMQPLIHSDYLLIDRLKGNRARYLFPSYVEHPAEAGADFHRVASLRNPERVAADVLAAVDRVRGRS